jgi:hypothetical protein
MIRVRYATCPLCFERQAVGRLVPGSKVPCVKCGEVFAIPDPRLSGKRGLLRRLAGFGGMAAAAACIVFVAAWPRSKADLGSLAFQLLDRADHGPVLEGTAIRSPSLGWSIQLPPSGWEVAGPEGLDGAVHWELRHRDHGGRIAMAAVRVTPAAGAAELRAARAQQSGEEVLRFLGRVSGIPIHLEAFAFVEAGSLEGIEFDFQGMDVSPAVRGKGFVLFAGNLWLWFYIRAAPPRLPDVIAQARTLMGTLRVRR